MTRVHIYFQITQEPWGGGNSFLRALRKTFQRNPSHEIKIVEKVDDTYDILLINGGHAGPGKLIKPAHVRNLKRWGYKTLWNFVIHGFRKQPKKIIYRLDGARKIYAGQIDAMYHVQQECIKLADYIIFQSQFSVDSFKEAGVSPERYSIIYNGVDSSFFPMSQEAQHRHKPLRIITASWSRNPMKGHETIAAFSELPGVAVTFIGSWPREIPQKNVTSLPPMQQEELGKEFQHHDLFLFPGKNEACPNIVSEALSCGLPVLYEHSGGTPEIASHYGVILTGDHARDLREILERYDELQASIRENRNMFSIEHAAALYADVFRRVNQRT